MSSPAIAVPPEDAFRKKSSVEDDAGQTLPAKFRPVEGVTPDSLRRLFQEGLGDLNPDDPFGFQKRTLAVQFFGITSQLKLLDVSMNEQKAVDVSMLMLENLSISMQQKLLSALTSGEARWTDELAREYAAMNSQFTKGLVDVIGLQRQLYDEKIRPLAQDVFNMQGYSIELQAGMAESMKGSVSADVSDAMGKYLVAARQLQAMSAEDMRDVEALMGLQEDIEENTREVMRLEIETGRPAEDTSWLGGEKLLESAELMANVKGLELREKAVVLGAEMLAARHSWVEPRVYDAARMQAEIVAVNGAMLIMQMNDGGVPADVQKDLVKMSERLESESSKLLAEAARAQDEEVFPLQKRLFEAGLAVIGWQREHMRFVTEDFRPLVEKGLELQEKGIAIERRMFERGKQRSLVEKEVRRQIELLTQLQKKSAE